MEEPTAVSHEESDDAVVVTRWHRVSAAVEAGQSRLEALREKVRAVDVVLRVHERDRHAAGTLLGSALALRLFLYFIPFLLVAVGLAGLAGHYGGVDGASSTIGISGSLAEEIDDAFEQGGTAPWVAVSVGLIGIATTGRSLTRALVLSSALSWGLGGDQKLRVRAIGIVTGAVVGMTLAAALLNRLRVAAGLAVASVSYVALAATYLLLWVVVFVNLPRRTTDPGAALPGALIMAALMTGLQMVVQLYLPHQIESASDLYGGIGVVVATLGWFFFVGRTIALSLAVNAVLYEEVGSISTFVFGLPGLRLIPRRVRWVNRYFDLGEGRHDR